jgi:hypothetical protein
VFCREWIADLVCEKRIKNFATGSFIGVDICDKYYTERKNFGGKVQINFYVLET